jgi:hypothetical protein
VDPDESGDGEPHGRLPEGLLTTIVVGSRASEEDRARVAELTADEFFRDVEVLQASVSGEEFRIDLAPLNGT